MGQLIQVLGFLMNESKIAIRNCAIVSLAS
jgi:hypothetical protein